MNINVKVEKLEEGKFLPLHEEIAKFNGGRVLSTLPQRTTIFEFDGQGSYAVSVQDMGESLIEALGIKL